MEKGRPHPLFHAYSEIGARDLPAHHGGRDRRQNSYHGDTNKAKGFFALAIRTDTRYPWRMATYKNCQAFIKVRKALKEMSQRELAEKTKQTQGAICQIAAGQRKPRGSAARSAFKSIGVAKADWE